MIHTGLLVLKYFLWLIPWLGLAMATESEDIASSATGGSKEIKLSFKYVDGKFIPIVQKDPIEEDQGMSSAAVSAVFLLLIIMLSFIGNALLIGTIGSSITLKR